MNITEDITATIGISRKPPIPIGSFLKKSLNTVFPYMIIRLISIAFGSVAIPIISREMRNAGVRSRGQASWR